MRVWVEIPRWPGTDHAQTETRAVGGTPEECTEAVRRWRQEWPDSMVVHMEGKRSDVETVKEALRA
jgi:hypothetical protein